MATTTAGDLYEQLPKVELHLHLEGAIPLDALWELMQKYGGDPEVPDLAALERRFEYRDFLHFTKIWDWKNQFLREYEDFTYIARAVAQDLAEQNIRYVEAFFSAPDFAPYGLKTQRLVEAIRAGMEDVPEVEVALVADLVRDHGPQRAAVTVEEVAEVRALGVIGIGLGGSEHAFPPEPFAAVYSRARNLGFRTTAHAGELAGPESIWAAIRHLQVDRLGHGTRAFEDKSLVDYLAKHRIPLEMCPQSNICTGVVARLEDHPIRRYFDLGLFVTVNTDDPKMFNTSLAREMHMLAAQHGFSRTELRVLILQGIQASWLPNERKRQLVDEFCRHPAWQQVRSIESIEGAL